MTSLIEQIATAIVAALIAGPFDPPLAPVVGWRPVLDKNELATLHVTVIPSAAELTRADRATEWRAKTIQVAFQKNLSETDESDISALVELVEQAADVLLALPLTDFGSARVDSVSTTPLYDGKLLLEERIFQSIISVKYQVRA